jgi:hypothetical protein
MIISVNKSCKEYNGGCCNIVWVINSKIFVKEKRENNKNFHPGYRSPGRYCNPEQSTHKSNSSSIVIDFGQ